MSDLKQRFGRPLRLGIVGGGPESWIGKMHRSAAELDGWWRCTAGVFSSDPARSRAAGVTLGFAADRSYGTVEEMIAAERQRDDGIDAVAIMTPNDTHYPVSAAALDAGLDVMCDKPVTHDAAQARDTLRNATKLWTRPVSLLTKVEGKGKLLRCEDGNLSERSAEYV